MKVLARFLCVRKAYQWMVDHDKSDIVGGGSLIDTVNGRGWLQCIISDNLSLAS